MEDERVTAEPLLQSETTTKDGIPIIPLPRLAYEVVVSTNKVSCSGCRAL